MSDDLITWLRDELQNARMRAEVLQAMGGPNSPLAPETAQFLRDAGDQALAEVEAKRRIIDRCERVMSDIRDDFTAEFLADDVLSLLAQPYADLPGYRSEWAPPNG